MIAHGLAWFIAAVCALAAAAVFVWHKRSAARLLARAQQAEHRLALLGQIAPALTEAATESVPATCDRIVERFGTLVRARTVLCVIARDGRLLLGAKSESGYASFLRVGDLCEGDSIVDWVEEHLETAIVGPSAFAGVVPRIHSRHLNVPRNANVVPRIYSRLPNLPPDVVDLSSEPSGFRKGGPLVGSRDRVWALCIPMLQQRRLPLRPSFVGAIYAERGHEEPFTLDEIRTGTMIAHIASDALQRARFADDVKRESAIDQLTQLLSASAFRKRLREEIDARRIAQSGDLALLFIDTDRFKLWNDTLGHAVGDTLLKKLAELFREVAATGGFAGRNGGDEFCIALLGRTKDDAVTVAEGLRKRVELMDFMAAPDGGPQPSIPITISIGIAHFPVDVPASVDAPADRLLEAADARMYEAKREGRNRVAYSRARPLQTQM